MGHFNYVWVNIVLAGYLFYITNAVDHVCQENNLCCTYKIGMTLKQLFKVKLFWNPPQAPCQERLFSKSFTQGVNITAKKIVQCCLHQVTSMLMYVH